MKVAQLRRSLDRLESMLTGMGAKAAAKDLHRLTDMMAGHDSLTVNAFAEKVEKALAGVATPPPKKKSAPKPLNEEAIDAWAARIEEKRDEPKDIDGFIATLGKDKDIRVAELRELVTRVTDVKPGAQAKRQLLDLIRRSLIEEARDSGKLSFIERLKSWD